MAIPTPSCVASRWLSSRTARAYAPLPEEVLEVVRKYREMATRGVCPVTPRVYRQYEEFHPLAGACRGLSVGLAHEIDRVLGRRAARVVGGWYRKADPDYYYPSDYVTYPPEGLRREGERWREHWWVELDGHYIDVSADQFFPSDVVKQKAHEVVVVPKTTEVYYPYRRRPLRDARPLPPNLEALAAKIASMKQSVSWGVRGNAWKMEAWLKTNARKFDVDPDQVADLMAVLRHEDTRVDMGRVEDVRALLREIA